MARDNSRVPQALFIIAREHSGPSAKWERTLSRRLAVATAAAGSCKSFSTYSPGSGQPEVIQKLASGNCSDGFRSCLTRFQRV